MIHHDGCYLCRTGQTARSLIHSAHYLLSAGPASNTIEEEHVLAAKFVAMTALLISSIGWSDATPLPMAGRATYYAPGLMERVWKYRLAVGKVKQCPDASGSGSNDADRRYRAQSLDLEYKGR